MTEKTPAPAHKDTPAKARHRADAVQTFMAAWLPTKAVAADAFTAEDAEALLAAIDAH